LAEDQAATPIQVLVIGRISKLCFTRVDVCLVRREREPDEDDAVVLTWRGVDTL
jgi:hypothetical protein